jgi:SAM-dependent methyltransferase
MRAAAGTRADTDMAILRSAKKLLYWMGVPRRLSRRRLRIIDGLLDGRLLGHPPGRRRLLDVGCATGKDFVGFMKEREDLEIVGIDLKDYGLRQPNFRMVVADAVDIPFPDRYFDIAVSVGVLEHIRPIEKLARVVQEIDRVSKSYAVIVPSISTFIEPHIARFFWQLRNRNKKPPYGGTLIYMSDEAWLALGGFAHAKTCRYSHIPLLINNLVVYKSASGRR